MVEKINHRFFKNIFLLLFQVFAERNALTFSEFEAAKIQFFSKGQACFRASPLTKTHGFGIHFNEVGKMAFVAMESETYSSMVSDDSIQKAKAMHSKKIMKDEN